MQQSTFLTLTVLLCVLCHPFAPIWAQLNQQQAASVAHVQGAVVQGPPNEGYLDSFHSPLEPDTLFYDDPDEIAFYALRFIRTAELLRTRKAYLELMGLGSPRMQPIHKDAEEFSIKLKVPTKVKTLFLSNKNNTKKLIPIALLVEQIEKSRYPFDYEKRKKVIEAMAIYSAVLTELDNQLQFLSQDMWEQNEYYKTLSIARNRQLNAETVARSVSGMGFVLDTDPRGFKQTKEMLMLSYGITDKIVEIINTKDFIFENYPLLAIDFYGRPYYQHIYHDLKKHGLPQKDQALEGMGVDFELPNDQASVHVPNTFQVQLTEAMGEIFNEERGIDELYPDLTTDFDRALSKGMQSNYEALIKLCEDKEYRRGSVLSILLASNEKTWSQAENSFHFIPKEIFQQAKEFYQEESKRYYQRTKWTYWGTQITGYTLMAISGVLYFTGIGAPLAVGCTGVAGILISSGGVIYKYRKSKELRDTYEQFFWNVPHAGKYSQLGHLYQIAESDHRTLVITALLNVFVGGRIMLGLIPERIFGAIGSRILGFTQASVDKIKSGFARLGNVSFLRFTHLGAHLKSIGRFFKVPLLGEARIAKINQHLWNIANKMGITPEAVHATKIRLYRRYLSKTRYEKLNHPGQFEPSVRSQFYYNFLLEVGGDMTLALLAEIMIRQEDFFKQLHWVAQNVLVVGSLQTVLVFRTFRVLPPAMRKAEGPDNIFRYPVRSKQFWSTYLNPAKEIAILSAPIALVGAMISEQVIAEAAEKRGEDVNREEQIERVAMNVLYSVLFLSLWSNFRINGVYWLRYDKIKPWLQKKYPHNPDKVETRLQQLSPFPSLGNNAFGSLNYTWGLTASGIQEMNDADAYDMPEAKKIDEYVIFESNENNAGVLFPFLEEIPQAQ